MHDVMLTKVDHEIKIIMPVIHSGTNSKLFSDRVPGSTSLGYQLVDLQ